MNKYIKSELFLEQISLKEDVHKHVMDECDTDKFNFDLGYSQACRDIASMIKADNGILTLNGYDAFAEYVLSKKEGEKQ